MESTERAVVRLTEPHTEWTEAGATEWPPLLVWLEESVTEIVGRGGGSGGGTGLPFNAEALALLTYIDGRVKLMQDAIPAPPGRDRLETVRNLWRTAQDERDGGRLDDSQWENICAEFPEWVMRIQAEDDRPRKLELTVPCPRCEQRWILLEGDRVSAIRIEFKPGGAPVAECRNSECEAIWAGWSDIAKLGYTVGAEQNMEVLAACGIDLRQALASQEA